MINKILSLFRTSKVVKEDMGTPFIPDDPRYQRLFASYLGLFYRLDRMARARGGYVVDRPVDERMIFIARDLMEWNPTAIGFINTLRTYTLGCKGFRVNCIGEASYLTEAQKYIDKFKDQQDWWQREREIYDRVHVEGEAILRFTPTADSVTLRYIEPEWVIPPDGTDEWTFGIHNEEGDVESIDGYSAWYGATQDIISADEVVHIKSKITPRCIKRGKSDFKPCCQIVDDSYKVWRNYLQSEAVRAGIVYFSKQAEGVTGDDIDAAIAGQADYRPPSTQSVRSIPPTKLTQGAGVEYLTNGTELAAVPSPEGVAGTVAGVNAALLLMGRPYNMPLWLISGDMSQNNVVDLGHESPFGAAIQDEQNWYSRNIRTIYKKVLQIGVEQGHLPEAILTAVDLCVESENKPPRDILDNTNRLKTLEEDGVISRRTRTTGEGYDYDEEQEQRIKDNDVRPREPVKPAQLRITR